jgi:hypothetical protein
MEGEQDESKFDVYRLFALSSFPGNSTTPYSQYLESLPGECAEKRPYSINLFKELNIPA